MRHWHLFALVITFLLLLFPPWRRTGLWQSDNGPPSERVAARYDRYLFGYLPYTYSWVGSKPAVFTCNGVSVDRGDGFYSFTQYTLTIDWLLWLPPIILVWLPVIARFLVAKLKR